MAAPACGRPFDGDLTAGGLRTRPPVIGSSRSRDNGSPSRSMVMVSRLTNPEQIKSESPLHPLWYRGLRSEIVQPLADLIDVVMCVFSNIRGASKFTALAHGRTTHATSHQSGASQRSDVGERGD